MAREAFIDKTFRGATLEMIDQANQILAEYYAQGFTMTLRQLHYQFVSRSLYENTQQNYKRLGVVMSDARLAGLVDWAMMEDRLRELERCPRWASPSQIINAVAEQYKEDPWRTQVWRPEVWIEKDALAGVIERACTELRIDYFACRGYVSQSAQYTASKRFDMHRRAGQQPIVFHLGDHDPSGIDMTRENRDKFQLLTGWGVEVRRLALNMDQVEQYNPPPNFAKTTDTRYAGYITEYGTESWELDALDPNVIDQLIRDAVNPLINRARWDTAMEEEKENRARLANVANNWEYVVERLENRDEEE